MNSNSFKFIVEEIGKDYTLNSQDSKRMLNNILNSIRKNIEFHINNFKRGRKIMYCEKCGNKINEGERFCEKCGTPVPNVTQSTNVQNNNNVPIANNVVTPVANAPVQVKVKKPVPKKLVIIGIIILSLIIVIVALKITLPILNSVKVKDYITINFDGETLYEGHSSGTLTIDSEAISDKYIKKTSKSDQEQLNDFANSVKNGDWDSAFSNASVGSILDYCNIKATVKGVKETTSSTDSDNDEDYGSSSVNLTNLKSSDVINVSIKWDTDAKSKQKLNNYEQALGIKFDRSDAEFEINVKDILQTEKLEMKKCVNTDVLKYIADKKLVKTNGFKDGEMTSSLGEFSYTEGKYEIATSTDSYYRNTLTIKEKDSDDILDNVYLNFSESSYLSDGDTITISISNEHPEGTDLFFTTTEKDFTVTANKPMTLESSQKNIDKIKKDAVTLIKEKYDLSYDPEIKDAYYLTSIGTSEYNYNNILVFMCKVKSSWDNSDEYEGINFFDTYMDGDTLCYDSISTDCSEDKLKDAVKYESYLSDKEYQATKVK